MRSHKPAASDLLASGWLTPNAAADHLGISRRQLENRARKNEIKRREISPGTGIYLYEIPREI